MGCKGKYEKWLTKDGLKRIRGWARDRKTNYQIASLMGISTTTFNDWIRKYPAFSASLEEGRKPVLVDLKDNMLSRCEWRKVEEKTTEKIKKPNGQTEMKVKVVERWIPPDCGMMQFMAKNWMPDEFKDKQEIVVEESESLKKAKEILSNVKSVIG